MNKKTNLDYQDTITEKIIPEIMQELTSTGECMIADSKYTLDEICEDAALWDRHNNIVLAALKDSMSGVVEETERLSRAIETWMFCELSKKDRVIYYFEGDQIA